jgi:PhoH-like ATPase
LKKRYVLDTNVLLHDPSAALRFEDNDVILPITVLEEVDRFKKDMTELGRNARMVARTLDALRDLSGSLSVGVPLESGGSLRVALPDVRSEISSNPDQAILEIALQVQAWTPAVPTILVTMDTNLRVRADAMGLRAESYETDRVEIEQLYSGFSVLEVTGAEVDALHAGGIPADGHALFANQCVLLRDMANPSHTALARADATATRLQPLRVPKDGVWGVRPRNKEQTFAFDLLLDDSVRMVTLVGKAGTGKTLLAIAAGLRKVADEEAFGRLLVSRPIFPLGRDIGYLPGDVGEKLNPWMQPIFDNLELILGSDKKQGRGARNYESLAAAGLIQIEPLTYIRGRSLPNQYLVVDEAQNLTPHEVKTIITRVGPNTKIVLTGDPYQIDNPYVDAESNGLTCVADRFKSEALSGHVLLTKGERSELAELAANLL